MIAFLAGFLSRGASGLRAILGVPDYERYLSHMREAHPGDRVMSETEFDHSRMIDRYNRPGSRCC
ncbi:MAG TPA: YbdD/YjiX family protein [Gemmatimonadaceae bacterium]|nr:YbdD/YjiX family protein [Gemmatimonadaceae bacterium]